MATRRTFLKLTTGGQPGRAVDRLGAGERPCRRRRWRLRRRHGGAHAEGARAQARSSPWSSPTPSSRPVPSATTCWPPCARFLNSSSATTGVKTAGVTVAQTSATAVDASAKTVTLADGNRLSYDRLVMSPGIDINWGALPRLRRSRRREDAACLEGRCADRAAAPAAAGDGRWRPGGDLLAGQSLPLPARARTSGPA